MVIAGSGQPALQLRSQRDCSLFTLFQLPLDAAPLLCEQLARVCWVHARRLSAAGPALRGVVASERAWARGAAGL